MRVLIAEDETLIRLDLRALLEQAGIEVCGEARNGVEAVELAARLEPDVVLLDVKMPELDGIEAARRIVDRRPTPIVIVSAFGEDELVKRAVEVGVFGYLTKPFREQDVVPAIRTACARHEDLAALRAETDSAGRGARGAEGDRAGEGAPDGEGGPHRGRGLRAAARREPGLGPADEGDRRGDHRDAGVRRAGPTTRAGPDPYFLVDAFFFGAGFFFGSGLPLPAATCATSVSGMCASRGST